MIPCGRRITQPLTLPDPANLLMMLKLVLENPAVLATTAAAADSFFCGMYSSMLSSICSKLSYLSVYCWLQIQPQLPQSPQAHHHSTFNIHQAGRQRLDWTETSWPCLIHYQWPPSLPSCLASSMSIIINIHTPIAKKCQTLQASSPSIQRMMVMMHGCPSGMLFCIVFPWSLLTFWLICCNSESCRSQELWVYVED